ncbi:MAG TPA: c-type cytochrome, partial [Longimicrobium sp.]|nr:c-type cytochrome [Longimicrobium sp.]
AAADATLALVPVPTSMHNRAALRSALLLAALAACVGPATRTAPDGAPPAAQQREGEFENLQVLPDSISRDALIGIMRNFTMSLGVRCTHCHVPYEGAPPDSLNFASDDKEAKHTARGMMRMVRAINGELMPDIRGLEDGRMQVGCITCHRGAPRPQMLEDSLATVARRLGADSAVAAYRALRTQYYGRFTYDFGERSLSTLAQRLAAEGRQADARRILELNAEQFPNSAGVAYELGRVLEALGERDRAVEQYRRAVGIQPNHRQAQERLRALGAQP